MRRKQNLQHLPALPPAFCGSTDIRNDVVFVPTSDVGSVSDGRSKLAVQHAWKRRHS